MVGQMEIKRNRKVLSRRALRMLDHIGGRYFAPLREDVRPPNVGGYMCSIILSPNCEHLISVAPCINRAKS